MGCNCNKNNNNNQMTLSKKMKLQSLEWQKVLKQFATSMIKWTKEGLPTVTKQKHDERYNTCLSCDKYDNHRCSECGCVVYVKCKLETEHCPTGKW